MSESAAIPEPTAPEPEALALAVKPLRVLALRPVGPSTVQFLPNSPLPEGRPIEVSTLVVVEDLAGINNRPIFKSTILLSDHMMGNRPIGISPVPVPEHSPLPNNRPIFSNDIDGDDLISTYD